MVAPYQSILSEATRDSLGISLLNKVLVFDEAHNIMETVSSLNNVTVNYSVLYQGFSHTQAYLRKYEARLSAKNAKFLRDVSQICADFSKYIRLQWTRQTQERAVEVIDVLTELDLYRVDFYKLDDFFQKSEFSRKISGFIQSQQGESF